MLATKDASYTLVTLLTTDVKQDMRLKCEQFRHLIDKSEEHLKSM